MNKSNIVAIALLITSIGLGKVFAADTPAAPTAPTPPSKPAAPGKDADGFWKEQKAAWDTHHKQQMEENKAFMATLTGKTAEEKKSLCQQHFAQQETENKAFETEMHTKAIAHVEASTMTAEKKAEVIKNLQARWAQQDAKRAEMKAKMKGKCQGKGGPGKGGHGKGKGGTPPAAPTAPTAPAGT